MALDKKMYRNCIGAIISLNAELPEDDGDKKYRIVFDSEQYYQKIKDSYLLVCTECDKETPRHLYRFLTLRFHKPSKSYLVIQQEKSGFAQNAKKKMISNHQE